MSARLASFLAVCLALTGTLAALNVSLVTPFSWQNTSAWTLNFSVNGNASSCALYSNESGWSAVMNTSAINSSNNAFSRNFTSGVWLWSVSCADANETVFASTNATLGVDLVLPTVPALSVVGYNVSWSSNAFDALSGLARFELYRNDSLVLNTSNFSILFFMDFNSSANASYVYRLNAVDAAGNRNASSALFEPLMGLSGLSVVQVAPRTLNVSWQTLVGANESVTLVPPNASVTNHSSSLLSTSHSVNLTTPVFGSVNVTVVSCLRSCFNQTVVQSVPPTINASMTFYNAAYNNGTAVLSVRWESRYGLTLVSVSTNNSGTTYPVLSSTLPGSLFHAENVTFLVNESAREVVWSTRAMDINGDSIFSSYALRLNPAVSRPIDSSAPNTSFYPLRVGEEINVSNGFRLRLVGLSAVPVGPSNELSALLETYAPSGELESRFSVEENGRHNTTAVAVELYRAFLGLGNNSYAQVNAYALTSIPTPTPEPIPEPTATPIPSSANVSNASSTSPLNYSGRLVRADVVVPPRANGSIFSGYVLTADDSTAVLFNSTYEHVGNSASLFLLVRVQDPASNKTLLVTRSRSYNASDGKTLFFSTAPVSLAPGDYVADALVVSEDNDRVVDSRPMRFAVQQPGASDAVALVGLLGVLALGVFVFTLKVNHHKKGLFP